MRLEDRISRQQALSLNTEASFQNLLEYGQKINRWIKVPKMTQKLPFVHKPKSSRKRKSVKQVLDKKHTDKDAKYSQINYSQLRLMMQLQVR